MTGRRIVKEEQQGKERAEYGTDEIISCLPVICQFFDEVHGEVYLPQINRSTIFISSCQVSCRAFPRNRTEDLSVGKFYRLE